MGARVLRRVRVTSGQSALIRRWNAFWFEGIAPDVYALLRIAFGVIGLGIVLGLTPIDAYWSLDGLAPIPSPGGRRAWLIAQGWGNVGGHLLFALMVAGFIAMILGVRSRSAVVFCFAATVLQTIWNRLPLSGANKAFMVVLFCLVWAEAGRCWSVDARTSHGSGQDHSSRVPIWPLRLMRYQLGLIYLNSGLWKLFGATWRDGTALHYAMSSNVFQRFPFALPGTSDTVLTFLTYLTLFWELLFVPMMFNRWTRRLALIIGVGLHIGTWTVMEVGPFSPVMLAAYLAFLEPGAPRRLFERFSRRPIPGIASVTAPE
jgi:hypothetical protein